MIPSSPGRIGLAVVPHQTTEAAKFGRRCKRDMTFCAAATYASGPRAEDELWLRSGQRSGLTTHWVCKYLAMHDRTENTHCKR